MADPMTPADDALRAAVERVEQLTSPQGEYLSDGYRLTELIRASRVLLSSLTAPPVTEEMVKDLAVTLCSLDGRNPFLPADEMLTGSDASNQPWITYRAKARHILGAGYHRVLAAAGGGK